MRPFLAALVCSAFALAAAQQVAVPTPTGGIPAGTVVASSENPSIKVQTLKAVNLEDFQGLRVTAGKVSRTFPSWRAISNPTFWPELTVQDLTGDKRPEVLVTLMTDEGTGVAVYDARVLTLPDLRERPVVAPVPALLQRVKFGVGKLTLGGKTVKLKLPEGDFNEPARIGDQVRWSVRGGKLTAAVEVQQQWAFIGRLYLSYRLAGGQFVPDTVSYDPKELE